MSQHRVIGRRVAGWLSAVVVVSGAIVAPPAAHAAPQLAPVMLVLDASGSMGASTTGGETKMKAAKEAVNTLVRHAPDDARMGLAVYGTGTGNAAADKAAGCKDVKVVHKVEALDRSALTTAVDGAEPRGYTPIGQSLRVAAAELPAEGHRSIVLISDGEDTCAPPDPCQVARQLHQQGVDLRIHAIGFQVDGKARQQLTCVAQATGGSYVDAPDAGSLAGALNRITQRALRFYEPVGSSVVGTKTPQGAPRLRPGAYLDRIRTNESRFYSVDVPPGYTLYAGATAVVPPDNQYFVHVKRYDGEECSGRADSGATTQSLPAISVSLQWTAPAVASPSPPACDRAGPHVVQVSLEPVFAGREEVDAALEVVIGLEPPLRGDAGPPGSTQSVTFSAPAGPARPVAGGSSFSAATALEGPGSFTDTVFEGEMVFYRVRLAWGQGLAYRLRLAQQTYTGSSGGFRMTTFWFNPARSQQDSSQELYNGQALTIPTSPDVLASPPVRYRNRESSGADGGVSVAGWYYIAVRAEPDHPGEAVPVSVTLDLSVNGKAQPEPGYAGNGDTDTFGDHSTGIASGSSGDASTRSKGGIWSTVAGTGPILWAGMLLLVLLVAVLTGALVIHRRRRW